MVPDGHAELALQKPDGPGEVFDALELSDIWRRSRWRRARDLVVD
jgi:hypothetical protein